jgi:Protein of unknown function (DUF3987)
MGRLLKRRFTEATEAAEAKLPEQEVPEPKAKPAPQVRSWEEVVVPAGANELEALTYVPGLVGDITEWIVRGSIRPNRMLALGVAVTIVGTLTGRWVQGPTGSATHLYIVIIGPSGIGKDDPLKLGKNVMKAVGPRELIGPDGFASAPGFVKRVVRNPLLICFLDEMGDELAKINDQQGNAYVAALVGLLKKLYNAWESQDTPEKAQEESENIEWPAVSLVGAATPEAFFENIKPKDLESGFANRFMILPFEGVERPPEQKRPTNWDVPPKELVQGLKRLPKQKAHGFDLDAPSGKATLQRLDMMPWDAGAEDEYYQFSRRLDALTKTNPRRDQIAKRGAENAVRLATNMASGRGSSTVDLEDIAWAIKFAERSIDAACGGYEKYMQEYLAFPKFCARVLAEITAHGWCSKRNLHRTFRKNERQGFELENAIGKLIKEERIKSVERTYRGQTSPGWAITSDAED